METITPKKRTSLLAILGLVLAILSLPLLFVPYFNIFMAVICLGITYYASSQIKKDVTSTLGGAGVAKAGFMTSCALVVLSLLFTFIIIPAINRQIADVFKPIDSHLDIPAPAAPASQ